jgi:hypothetical protein
MPMWSYVPLGSRRSCGLRECGGLLLQARGWGKALLVCMQASLGEHVMSNVVLW